MTHADDLALAERVRQGCIEAAARAHEEAALSGLCSEGAREAAIDAMRSLDLDRLVGSSAPGTE